MRYEGERERLDWTGVIIRMRRPSETILLKANTSHLYNVIPTRRARTHVLFSSDTPFPCLAN